MTKTRSNSDIVSKAAPNGESEVKTLATLSALLAYALRELQSLDSPCADAEISVAAAQVAVCTRLMVMGLPLEATPSQPDEIPERLN